MIHIQTYTAANYFWAIAVPLGLFAAFCFLRYAFQDISRSDQAPVKRLDEHEEKISL